eukprot:4960508-Pleurochrysis_carterae.AAC.3
MSINARGRAQPERARQSWRRRRSAAQIEQSCRLAEKELHIRPLLGRDLEVGHALVRCQLRGDVLGDPPLLLQIALGTHEHEQRSVRALHGWRRRPPR